MTNKERFLAYLTRAIENDPAINDLLVDVMNEEISEQVDEIVEDLRETMAEDLASLLIDGRTLEDRVDFLIQTGWTGKTLMNLIAEVQSDA